jgi:hypothetical protein
MDSCLPTSVQENIERTKQTCRLGCTKRRGIEYETDSFELEGCKIVMKYGNSIKQEKQCGAKLILEVYIQDI